MAPRMSCVVGEHVDRDGPDARPATRSPRTSSPHRPTRRAARPAGRRGGGRAARRPGRRSAARSAGRPWRPRRCRAGGTRRRARPIRGRPAPAASQTRRAGRRGARSAAADRPGSAHLRQRPPRSLSHRRGRSAGERGEHVAGGQGGGRRARRRPASEPPSIAVAAVLDRRLQLAEVARRREVLVLVGDRDDLDAVARRRAGRSPRRRARRAPTRRP